MLRQYRSSAESSIPRLSESSSLCYCHDASRQRAHTKADASSEWNTTKDMRQSRHQISEAQQRSATRAHDRHCTYLEYRRFSPAAGSGDGAELSGNMGQQAKDDPALYVAFWPHHRTTVVDVLKDTVKMHADFNRALEQLGASTRPSSRSRRYKTIVAIEAIHDRVREKAFSRPPSADRVARC